MNVRKDFSFAVDIRIPSVAAGRMTQPALGTVTGITVRLSATPGGAAINGAVGNLAATEYSGEPGRFHYDCDTALLVTHVLPLGAGQPFYAVWSKAGDMDGESVEYIVSDGNLFT